MSPIELLAPAKDLEIGIAAIRCGADAVYIGAERFGAREAASNTLQDIESLVAYAHPYWAKVYVTMNTLLRDEEIPEAVAMVRRLHDMGVDGLIIQDVGLLECDLPPIPLIASTQMHNDSPEKAAFLEQVGFQRIILARELSLEQIRDIRKQTTIGLECFVHGALCVSFSGQCWMSYAIGGRSGNRGCCAQPCRRKYSLKDTAGRTIAEGKHLLSLKDMNRSEFLGELIDAGITTFKIEGRLKDISYVMNVTAYYRKQLDAVLKEKGLNRTSSGESKIDFTPDPWKTFNRGYTDYFLSGRKKSMSSMHSPKSTGERIGCVVRVGEKHFELDSPSELHAGDGICFFNEQMELDGTRIDRIQDRIVFPQRMSGMRPGLEIFRNEDAGFDRILRNSRTMRAIVVFAVLNETPSGFSLTMTDEDGVHAEALLECEKRPAEKKAAALETIRKQLSKTGGTHFKCENVHVALSKPYFLPVSELNQLRRSVIEKMILERGKNRPNPAGQIRLDPVPYPEKKLTYFGNVLNQKAAAFYRRHGVAEIELAAESGLNMRNRKVMTNRYCILYEMDLCRKKETGSFQPEDLILKDEDGRIFPLHFDCEKCRMEIYFGG